MKNHYIMTALCDKLVEIFAIHGQQLVYKMHPLQDMIDDTEMFIERSISEFNASEKSVDEDGREYVDVLYYENSCGWMTRYKFYNSEEQIRKIREVGVTFLSYEDEDDDSDMFEGKAAFYLNGSTKPEFFLVNGDYAAEYPEIDVMDSVLVTDCEDVSDFEFSLVSARSIDRKSYGNCKILPILENLDLFSKIMAFKLLGRVEKFVSFEEKLNLLSPDFDIAINELYLASFTNESIWREFFKQLIFKKDSEGKVIVSNELYFNQLAAIYRSYNKYYLSECIQYDKDEGEDFIGSFVSRVFEALPQEFQDFILKQVEETNNFGRGFENVTDYEYGFIYQNVTHKNSDYIRHKNVYVKEYDSLIEFCESEKKKNKVLVDRNPNYKPFEYIQLPTSFYKKAEFGKLTVDGVSSLVEVRFDRCHDTKQVFEITVKFSEGSVLMRKFSRDRDELEDNFTNLAKSPAEYNFENVCLSEGLKWFND